MAFVKKMKMPHCCPIKNTDIITPARAPIDFGLSNQINFNAVKNILFQFNDTFNSTSD
jgi:hypothetical protein